MKKFQKAKSEFVNAQIRELERDLKIARVISVIQSLLLIAMGAAFVLTTSKAHAEGITGHVEGRGYFHTNTPVHPDLTGDPMKYGVDFQLNFPTFIPRLSIMAGADAATGSHQFSQIAGRFGANLNLNSFDVGIYHRSNHSIDHTPVTGKFYNDNHVYLRYNIGDRK